MSQDLLRRLQNWMNGNPGKNTVGFIERPDGYTMKLHYGDKTTVIGEGKTLQDALRQALDKAQNYPPAVVMQAARRQITDKPVETVVDHVKLPGM